MNEERNENSNKLQIKLGGIAECRIEMLKNRQASAEYETLHVIHYTLIHRGTRLRHQGSCCVFK